MPLKPILVRHVTKEELEALYRRETNARVKERLLVILELYEGKNLKETGRTVRKHRGTVKRWLDRWNEVGYDGLAPQFGHGGKSFVTEEEWIEILNEIENRGFTIDDVREYVSKTRDVNYSYNGTWYALRKRMGVKYGKPYIQNAKRPEDAEERLKKRLMTH